jgi:hypothetical protein
MISQAFASLALLENATELRYSVSLWEKSSSSTTLKADAYSSLSPSVMPSWTLPRKPTGPYGPFAVCSTIPVAGYRGPSMIRNRKLGYPSLPQEVQEVLDTAHRFLANVEG